MRTNVEDHTHVAREDVGWAGTYQRRCLRRRQVLGPSFLDAIGPQHVKDIVIWPVVLVDAHGGQLVGRQATDLVPKPRVCISVQQCLDDLRVVQLRGVVEGRPALLVVHVDIYGLFLLRIAEVILHNVKMAILQTPKEPLLLGDDTAILLLLLSPRQRILPSALPLHFGEGRVHVIHVKVGSDANVSFLHVLQVPFIPLPEAQPLGFLF
eukprot:UN0994